MRIDRSVFRSVCQRGAGVCAGLAAVALLTTQGAAGQSPWLAVGPDGGDARSFVAVPNHPEHLYLGTTNSWIYESIDRGASWIRLGKLDDADDLVLDHIIVSPNNPKDLIVAGWNISHKGGGVWVSHDGGVKWKQAEGLKGQSIRAFTSAPSNPQMLIAGTLEGVFRSMDSGATWTQISPAGSNEIHEIESLAIGTADPNIIYAGTWHLPWKTTDGGKSWQSMKAGLIDDSDVFSIIIDPTQPSIVYTSACSGIYKSENGGELFHKIQGIPSTARRTRVLKQDPVDHQVVYAGTTEGLYKTVDGGKTFKRMTGPDVIVNDVFVDPMDTKHVLLATDRSGVLLSTDSATSFVAANRGFSGRKVEALLVDAHDQSKLFAGVANDKTYGGVFKSADGGLHWDHIGEGLDGRDVFALAQAADGTVLAGTNHGIFALGKDEARWEPRNTIQNTVVKKSTVVRKGKKVPVETTVKEPAKTVEGRVFALDLLGETWLASTTSGLLTSKDHGATWQGGPVLGSSEYLTVASRGTTFIAAQRSGVAVSTDAGQTWTASEVPASLTRIDRAIFTPDGAAWLGGREGVYVSKDDGKSWQWIERLPFKDVTDLYYDAGQSKVLVSSRRSDWIYQIDPAALNWTWTRAGWKVYLIRSAGGHLLGASLYDGVLVQPRAGGVESAAR
jgi:photosystem II stability/assembly factor-like uncharacterized protein